MIFSSTLPTYQPRYALLEVNFSPYYSQQK